MVETIFVTGGAGYIGSHTCKQLHKEGYLPVCYDNLSTGHEENVKWGPLIRADIRDSATLMEAFDAWKPSCVIHFAASAYVGESAVDPRKYYNNNVHGSLALFDACLDAGVGKIVFSSSCATYGIPAQLPIDEQCAQDPINPYGRTKLIGEMMLRDYAAVYPLNYVALRYFNAAGADPDGDLRERHDPETHLIPRALMAAAGGIESLQVFGEDYDTPDGTCIRDYVHVADLAQGHVQAVRHLLSGGTSMVANLGSGSGTSIREILNNIELITAKPVPMRMETRREGDPPILYSSVSKAETELGFQPRYSDIATIIRSAAPTFGLELPS